MGHKEKKKKPSSAVAYRDVSHRKRRKTKAIPKSCKKGLRWEPRGKIERGGKLKKTKIVGLTWLQLSQIKTNKLLWKNPKSLGGKNGRKRVYEEGSIGGGTFLAKSFPYSARRCPKSWGGGSQKRKSVRLVKLEHGGKNTYYERGFGGVF